jgi:hypothetical protein
VKSGIVAASEILARRRFSVRVWIAGFAAELRGEAKFLVEKRRFEALGYCMMCWGAYMMRARRRQRRRASDEKLAVQNWTLNDASRAAYE